MTRYNITGWTLFISLSFWHGGLSAYQSTYDEIQWEPRGGDTEYCIDITDENWNVYPGLQAIACGDIYSFSPRSYVQEQYGIELPDGFTFYWRVWSPGGYGDNGFEGVVRVNQDCGLPYRSDAEGLQWGCRFRDTFYCLDILDANGAALAPAHMCGENLHSFDPRELHVLNLATGTYRWKVWSESAYAFDGPQKYFEGEFFYTAPDAPPPPPSGECADLNGAWNFSNMEMNNTCQNFPLALPVTLHVTQEACRLKQVGFEVFGNNNLIGVDIPLRDNHMEPPTYNVTNEVIIERIDLDGSELTLSGKIDACTTLHGVGMR